jgi:hypothetical protein
MWTKQDVEDDAAVNEFMNSQRKATRKKVLVFGSLVIAALLVTWFASNVLFSFATIEREHEQWLKDNNCKVTSHREGEWNYHWIGDYYEHIPEETCYQCKTEAFCE